jgi:hypothetical protein
MIDRCTCTATIQTHLTIVVIQIIKNIQWFIYKNVHALLKHHQIAMYVLLSTTRLVFDEILHYSIA